MTESKTEKKILVVEDDGFLLEMLSDKLKKEGYQVFGAVNGEEALEKANLENPDLILLDIVIPVIDGITVLKRLRQGGKNVKIIILSNLIDAEKVEEAVKNGVHDYLVKKDWRPDDLINKVKEKLESD